LIGVSNFTGEDPPQVTTAGDTDAEIDYVGNSVFYSQYDWFGRRAFLNLTWDFQ
jgi:iron complex outermembrane receptor protein